MQKNKKEKAIAFNQENHSKNFRCGKRKTCKGGKEHDWLLTIPDYIKTTWEITPKMIIGYYKIIEKEKKLNKKITEEFLKIGINKYNNYNTTIKYYICSVCGKKDYK